MKNNKILLIILMLAFTACTKAKSNWEMNKPEQEASLDQEAERESFQFSPKAEILFVIDNSLSMSNHIARLSENIDVFVNAFSKNNPLEYNLAVMSVYDSHTFSTKKYQDKFGGTDAFFQVGQFRQIKKSPTEFVPNKYFISSKDEGLNELLRNTLKVGVQDTSVGGPAVEESFSPLAAAYGLSGYSVTQELAQRQKDFFMGKDSYKIIFFVTDAIDSSDITASELYSNLVKRSGGDRSKILAFGAIIPSYVHGCKADPGLLPNRIYKIEEFLKLTKKVSEPSNVVSLCDSFGQSFAEFGKSIRERTVSQIIRLNERIPVMTNPSQDKDVCLEKDIPANRVYDRLHVCFGEQEIPLETSKDIIGFKYRPPNDSKFPSGENTTPNSIRINPNFQFDMSQPNAKIRLLYTPVSARALKSGHVQRYGI